MTVENFVRIVRTLFEKIEKVQKCLFVIFGLNLAMFLRYQSCNFGVIAQTGAPLGVE